MITTTMLTFGMGASTQALFARVGGGIYTKAADVGADLVGKVEAGIPEDDPRNPATIADNVGDNVGDVAGMGADLYESYCGSILSTAALGASAFIMNPSMQKNAVFAPMIIAAIGVFLSILGIFLVRTKENASVKQLMDSLNRGVNVSAILIAGATFGILYLLGFSNWVGLSFSVIAGLLAGIIIGQGTEYFTSHSYKPTRGIAANGDRVYIHGDTGSYHCVGYCDFLPFRHSFRCREYDLCRQPEYGTIRYRHCCGGDALHTGNYPGYRCLWSYRR